MFYLYPQISKTKRWYALIVLIWFALFSNSFFATASNSSTHAPLLPNDSLLNRITDIDRQLKEFTEKDTLGGFSTPRKIETGRYFQSQKENVEVTRDKQGLIVITQEYEPFLSDIDFSDTVIFRSSMLPIVFDGKLLPTKVDFRKTRILKKDLSDGFLLDKDSLVSQSLYQYKQKGLADNYQLIDKENTLAPNLLQNERTAKIRKEYYTSNPDKIKSNVFRFSNSPIIIRELEAKNPFQELITVEKAVTIVRPNVEKYEIKQVYWKFGATHELKIAQRAYSGNWNPSTENNFNLQNFHKFVAKYKKNNIEFDHWVEWKLDLQTTPADSIHKVNINDDYIKTYNKLGLKAFVKNWSYIVTGEAKTPLVSKYPQNSKKKVAGILSPLELNFGLGMGYKLEMKSKSNRYRKLKMDIDTRPFSLDYKYIKSAMVLENDPRGIEKDKGKNSKLEIGSALDIQIDWTINSFINIWSKTKYFTNYERVDFETDNRISLILNKYFSTGINLKLRFNDKDYNRKRKSWGYFQGAEEINFGLSYKW